MFAHVKKGGGSASFLSNAMVTGVRRSTKPWWRNQGTDFFKALKRNESCQNEEKEESVSVIMLVVASSFLSAVRYGEISGAFRAPLTWTTGPCSTVLPCSSIYEPDTLHFSRFSTSYFTREATLAMVLVVSPPRVPACFQIFCIIQIWLTSTYSRSPRPTRTCKCSLHVPTAADRLYHGDTELTQVCI